MSLIGVDVGTTAVKAGAYSETGSALAHAGEPVPGRFPRPGWWEVDAEEVWAAVVRSIRTVAGHPALRVDPPKALAMSASGREVFPARADGTALGPCLRTADARRPEPDVRAQIRLAEEEWMREVGHVPDHMDPANRVLWWQQNHPEIARRARWYLGWHEQATLRLTGRPATDPVVGGRFAVFDPAAGGWSRGRLESLGIEEAVLPEVVGWGQPVGSVRPRTAAALGLPGGVVVVAGALDTSCGAVGAGAVHLGSVALASGTWESFVVPATDPDPAALLRASLVVEPHPSTTGRGVFGSSPNGTSVVDWALRLTGLPRKGLNAALQAGGPGPGPLLAVPHLSGAAVPWPGALQDSGELFGLTLSSSRIDVVRSLMEGIACDLVFSVRALRRARVEARSWRVIGGGSRSPWWMQLKADLTGMPVEIVAVREPGTRGAALLAGLGAGAFASLEETAELPLRIARRHDPDPRRAERFAQRLQEHRAAVRAAIHRSGRRGA